MSNGKGDTPRPLSVDNETFSSNWERTFTGNKPLTRPEMYALYEEYKNQLNSGVFWELHPELTGNWDADKDVWYNKMNNK